jgi:hypothetical protein
MKFGDHERFTLSTSSAACLKTTVAIFTSRHVMGWRLGPAAWSCLAVPVRLSLSACVGLCLAPVLGAFSGSVCLELSSCARASLSKCVGLCLALPVLARSRCLALGSARLCWHGLGDSLRLTKLGACINSLHDQFLKKPVTRQVWLRIVLATYVIFNRLVGHR